MNIDVDVANTSIKRVRYYPYICDHQDALWHDIDRVKLVSDAQPGTWYVEITAVKGKYPKRNSLHTHPRK